jgi:hypothetical protein
LVDAASAAAAAAAATEEEASVLDARLRIWSSHRFWSSWTTPA